jgi:hypothetical protein
MSDDRRDIFFRLVFLELRLGHFIFGIQTSSLNFQTMLLPLGFFGTQPSFFCTQPRIHMYSPTLLPFLPTHHQASKLILASKLANKQPTYLLLLVMWLGVDFGNTRTKINRYQ